MADANGHPCGDRALDSAGGNLWGHSYSEKQGLPLIFSVAARTVIQLTKALLPSFHPTPSFHKPLPSAVHNHLPWAASKPEQNLRLQGQLLSFTNVSNCWHPLRESGETLQFCCLRSGKQPSVLCTPCEQHRAEKHQSSRWNRSYGPKKDITCHTHTGCLTALLCQVWGPHSKGRSALKSVPGTTLFKCLNAFFEQFLDRFEGLPMTVQIHLSSRH